MRRLNNRGMASFELIFVFVPLFTLIFAIFDLARYAITAQSLRTLSSAGARAMMIQCYTPAITGLTPGVSPSSCTGNYMSATQKQASAPFLYRNGSSAPTVSITSGSGKLTVTASQAGFAMVMPIWGTSLNAPSASTVVPF